MNLATQVDSWGSPLLVGGAGSGFSSRGPSDPSGNSNNLAAVRRHEFCCGVSQAFLFDSWVQVSALAQRATKVRSFKSERMNV